MSTTIHILLSCLQQLCYFIVIPDINKVDKMQFQKSGYKNTFTDSTNESSIHSNER